MRRFVPVVAIVLFCTVQAHADLSLKARITTFGMMGMGASETIVEAFIKGGKMRTETVSTIQAGPGKSMTHSSVEIIRPDRGVEWILSEVDSTCYERKLGEISGDEQASQVRMKNIKVTETQETKTIAGYKCKGAKLEMVMESGTGEEVMIWNVLGKLWVAPEDKDLAELKNMWDETLKETEVKDGGGIESILKQMHDVQADLKGVVLGTELTLEMPLGSGMNKEQMQEMRKAMEMMKQFGAGKGKPMVEESPGKMTITHEVSSISKEKISDNLFEIPKGYKLVKQQE